MPLNGISGWAFGTKLKPPPTLRSMSHLASGTPSGSHHCDSSSGRVQALNTAAGGASTSRSSRMAKSLRSMLKPRASVSRTGGMSLLLFLSIEMSLQIVEAGLPGTPERLHPVGRLLERLRHQPARPPLRVAPALDQPGLFQHLEVLGNGGLGERERRHQFGH